LPNQIYGVDVRQCEANNYTFLKLSDEQDNTILPFNDGSVDVIVASMVLHHVKNQDSLISEFKRILSATGVIIIREHDTNNSYFSVFLDIVHGLYSFVSTNIKWPGFISEAKMIYRSKEEWDRMFLKDGFKLISDESESSLKHYHYEEKNIKNSSYKNKPRMSNVLRAYCAVYAKIK
jgi:ubiquinone/menaquinone biosynthesis C-methylase UbiE